MTADIRGPAATYRPGQSHLELHSREEGEEVDLTVWCEGRGMHAKYRLKGEGKSEAYRQAWGIVSQLGAE